MLLLGGESRFGHVFLQERGKLRHRMVVMKIPLVFYYGVNTGHIRPCTSQHSEAALFLGMTAA